MRSVERHIQEERLFRSPQKAAGLLGNQVRYIAVAFNRLIVLIQHRLAAPARLMMVEVIDVAAERTEGIIETVLQRQKLCLVAEVPLADERGGVACVAQERRQRRVRRRQAQARIAARVAADRLVGAAPKAMLPAAGHQREACRRTDRRVSVAQPES